MSTEERVQRLERANRNLRWCLAGIVLCLVGLEAWRRGGHSVAQAEEKPPAVLSVKRLNIVNAEGEIASSIENGVLTMGAATISSYPGYALLTLDDGENALTLTPNGVSLGKRSAAGARERDRVKRLIAAGGKGLSREEIARGLETPEDIKIGIGEHGGGFLILKNSRNKEVVSIQANKNNVGGVYVSDQNGKIQQTLTGQP